MDRKNNSADSRGSSDGDAPRVAGRDAVVVSQLNPGQRFYPSAPVPDAMAYKPEALLPSANSRRSFIQAGNSASIRPKRGGGAGAEAPAGSCFNQIRMNRDSTPKNSESEPLTRGKRCGVMTLVGTGQDGARRFHRLMCKCWRCSYCGPRRAKRVKRAIRESAEQLRLQRLVTLTLDPKRIPPGRSAVRYLRACFDQLRVTWRRRFLEAPQYIAVLEFQKSGSPHLHILVDRWMTQAWLKHAWESLGGGWSVDVRYVDIHNVARYLSKYLTKELLLSAPKRSRRVTTSRGVHLFPKKPASDVRYKLRKLSVDYFFGLHAAEAQNLQFDDEEQLCSFTTGPPAALAVCSREEQ